MAYRTSSTRRTTAASAVSSQAVVINSGAATAAGTTPTFSVSGSTIQANSSISLGIVTTGQTSTTTTTVISGGPVITNIAYLDTNNTTVAGLIAASTAGGNILITGTGFVANSNVYVNNTLVTNTFISSTQIRAQLPSNSSGNLSLYMFTPTYTGAISANPVRFSGPPVWVTTSLTMVVNSATSQALSASSDSTLTYTLQSGSSLPTGISLSSSGVLSGTPTGYSSNTVISPVIVATDQEGQATQQTINITITTAEPQFPYVVALLKTGSTNGATNSSFVDETTLNAITTTGDVYQGSYSPFSPNGWSTYFPATTDYLTTPTNSAFAFGTGAFTIEFWFFLSAAPTLNVQIAGVPIAGGIAVYSAAATGNVTINLNGTGDLLTSTYALGSTTIRNQWHHLVASRDSGGAMRIWIDGTSVGTATNAASISANAGFRIGPAFSLSRISNLRVTNTDVYGVSNATIAVPVAPLTAITGTVLLTCNSPRHLDSSSNNFTFTRNGTPNILAVSPFSPSAAWSASTHGGSAYFPGAAAYLSNATTTALTFGTGAYTVEFWMYYSGVATTGEYDILEANPAAGGFQIYVASSSQGLRWGSNGSTSFQIATAANIPINQWTHVVVSRTGTGTNQTVAFLNGVLAITATDSNNYTGIGLGMGGRNTGANYFTGYLSNLRVVKGTALYTVAFTPPTAPPTNVANTSLLMYYGNAAIYDAHASTGNDFETLNVTTSTARAKYATTSMLFNGTSSYLIGPASPSYIFGVGDFTVEFWVNFTATANRQDILYWAVGGTDRGGIVWNQTAGNLTYYISPTVAAAINTAWSPTANTWYHIALVRSSAVTKFYIDGVAKTPTYSDTRNYTASYQLWLGRDSGAASSYFNGYLEDVRITNGFARYTANFTPPALALLGQ